MNSSELNPALLKVDRNLSGVAPGLGRFANRPYGIHPPDRFALRRVAEQQAVQQRP